MTLHDRLEISFNDSRRTRIAVGGVLAVIGAAALTVALKKALTRELDLYVILNASRDLLAGRDIYAAPAANGAYYLYLPLLALFFVPLALLPQTAAGVLWTLVCIALVAWSLHEFVTLVAAESCRNLNAFEKLLLHVVPVILCADAISSEVGNAQVNCLILALAVLALKLAKNGNSAMAGMTLGLAAVAKVFTLPLVFYELCAKRFRIVVAAMICTFAGLLLPAAIVGLQNNIDFVTYWTTIAVNGDIASHRSGFAGNASLQAALTRLFTDVPAFTFHGAAYHLKIASLDPSVIRLIGMLIPVAMILLVVVYYLMFRDRASLISYWGGIALAFCVSPLITPVVERPHFVMLLPAYVYVTWIWLRERLRGRLFYTLVAAAWVLSTFTLKLYVGEFWGNVFWSLSAPTIADLCVIAAIFLAASQQNDNDLTAAR